MSSNERKKNVFLMISRDSALYSIVRGHLRSVLGDLVVFVKTIEEADFVILNVPSQVKEFDENKKYAFLNLPRVFTLPECDIITEVGDLERFAEEIKNS